MILIIKNFLHLMHAVSIGAFRKLKHLKTFHNDISGFSGLEVAHGEK